ncbi:putative GTP-binding protein YjiA [compost metagenome]
MLNIAGEARRLVFQGVLRLYGFDWDTEWQDGEARESVMVFIGDNLPEEQIRQGFEAITG